MKKIKLMALAMAASVAIMGAGYAYWTETLTINNTVTSGELSVIFQNQSLVYDTNNMAGSSIGLADENQTLNIVLNDLYPGAESTIGFDVINNGTLEAQLKNLQISPFNPDSKIHDKIKLTKLTVDNVDLLKAVGVSNVSLGQINQHRDKIEAALADMGDIAKNDSVPVQIDVLVDEGAVEADFPYNREVKFNLTADVHQFNDK